ncbi:MULTISPECIES: bifunctional 3-deoxy-7-phosphoheptulonate synthase/chorismate mutase type II [Flavobacterium]|uniref:chorismate mutase n=3 Tax=Flavobacterium TaxID=237 RepID=A0A1I1S930_9FLAO|nr:MULTISPECIES: bifunctional 3-deoxy-7-phosphoheptulonate synthase/chorismate mutase type II [Flavobacterium]NWK99839.1 3-deoxy-7-phosphoheptulonate synthase [Flavobacterium collinsii]KAF2509891.1 bifunctional 3-deoxy-7-phosphoheptulonate synthase/chorismate mutase type II [Flavobacterium foetidum]MBJ2124030.1 bifunctional 3-deoxy-7-phosphoheptulonate synthase/chorismate mutase type II [Flavobacterium sp. IB48]MBW1658068.1 3-deoxy-7-phosphoheptulonate synthase [Flavobacterium quisquiliarum]SF
MENKKEMRKWLEDFNLNHPLVIAGPCSAETEDQVLKIAHELKDSKVSVFRAGIWKPRTRPGGFEGIGEIGLKWLQKAKAETGLLMGTEVATAAHCKLALEYDIDVLWVGARTTANPFAVQEIADTLKGTDKIVLVKNPVNPDLALWLGGVERLHMAGIEKLGVIHRGFSTYEKTKYRNIPEWQIAIELQNKFPDLPLIIDPSHITGDRKMIFEVTQEALDLNYDGMIIETHIDPDNAWSDAAQQVTPDALKQIIKDLTIRKTDDTTDEYSQKMKKLRANIDVLDANLLELLGKRMKVADEIGQVKKDANVAILQNNRWNEILGKMILEGEKKGLTEEFVLRMFKAIHQESIGHQEKIFNA